MDLKILAYSELKKLLSEDDYPFAGFPKYMALFGRDSLITSIAFMNKKPEIAAATLNALSRYQGAKNDVKTLESPGKIPHEINLDRELISKRSKDVPWISYGPNYYSVDSTPLFITTFLELWKSSGKYRETVPINSFVGALDFIINSMEGNEFLGYHSTPYGMGPSSQCWRDGIGDILKRMSSQVYISGVQGFLAESLLGIMNCDSSLKEVIGKERMAKIGEILRRMRDNFTDRFYLEDHGYFALGYDGSGSVCGEITTDPLYCLGLGMIDKGTEKDIVSRSMEADLLTGYGMRSLSQLSPYFDAKAYQRGSIWPHDNMLVVRSLLRGGFWKEAKDVAVALKNGLDSTGSFSEYYSVDSNGDLMDQVHLRISPCNPQAWTIGSYLYIMENFKNL